MFLEALFFTFEKNFFRVSIQNFGHCRLHKIIGLQLSQGLHQLDVSLGLWANRLAMLLAAINS